VRFLEHMKCVSSLNIKSLYPGPLPTMPYAHAERNHWLGNYEATMTCSSATRQRMLRTRNGEAHVEVYVREYTSI